MQRLDEIDGLYHLDPAHSALSFTVRHAGLSRIRGTFDAFQGYAVFDRANLDNSALMVSIQVASINTQVAGRDAHLRAPDFFDVARFPAITFVGTGFRQLDDEHVLVRGDLTIRDVSRTLEIEFTYTGSAVDTFGGRRIGFEGSTTISRKDFGLTWNAALETGGWMISDEARIEVDASAVQQDDDRVLPRRASMVVEATEVPGDPATAGGDTLRRASGVDSTAHDQAGMATVTTLPRRAALGD